MRFGKKQHVHKLVYSKFGIMVLLIVLVVFARSVYGLYQTERTMAERRDEAAAALQSLQERKAALETEVEYMQVERGIEEEIRKNFDVAREGERVIILTGETPENEPSVDEAAVEPPAPWWKFWQ